MSLIKSTASELSNGIILSEMLDSSQATLRDSTREKRNISSLTGFSTSQLSSNSCNTDCGIENDDYSDDSTTALLLTDTSKAGDVSKMARRQIANQKYRAGVKNHRICTDALCLIQDREINNLEIKNNNLMTENEALLLDKRVLQSQIDTDLLLRYTSTNASTRDINLSNNCAVLMDLNIGLNRKLLTAKEENLSLKEDIMYLKLRLSRYVDATVTEVL